VSETAQSIGASELICRCGSKWTLEERGWTRIDGLGCSFCCRLIPVSHVELRPELREFAEEMEVMLRRHDEKKRGWELENPNWLMRRLLDELGEVIEAMNPTMGADHKAVSRYLLAELMRLTYHTTAKDKNHVRRELVDVANFCMFLHYTLGEKA
jgi:NTP pyrophosphatase (non-canonical NTP hydrolase)